MFIWTCDDASSNTWSPKLLHKFNDVVWHVSWSITANILAVSGGDNKVHPIAMTRWTGPVCVYFAHWRVPLSIPSHGRLEENRNEDCILSMCPSGILKSYYVCPTLTHRKDADRWFDLHRSHKAVG